MLKKIFKFFKKIIVSSFVLYSYNLISAPLNLIIPINIFTISTLTLLGLPSLFALIAILLIIY
ncbi:MAG: pro-sigmaK processing inhibitor BofA family protein [Firmicutes bacterium]|nr:pro-sigmaK processing inhibitor BofA family protein [Bacillota bacterium]